MKRTHSTLSHSEPRQCNARTGIEHKWRQDMPTGDGPRVTKHSSQPHFTSPLIYEPHSTSCSQGLQGSNRTPERCRRLHSTSSRPDIDSGIPDPANEEYLTTKEGTKKKKVIDAQTASLDKRKDCIIRLRTMRVACANLLEAEVHVSMFT